jgi:hypothetical protein
MEKDFLLLANFFHFGMEQMEPKRIKTVVPHLGVRIAFGWSCCYNASDFLGRFFVSTSK